MKFTKRLFLFINSIANLFLNLWSLRLSRKQFLQNSYCRLAELLESKRYLMAQKLDRKTLESYQLKQLVRLVNYAAKNTRFYSNLNTHSPDLFKISSLEDISKLPVVTKAIIRENSIEAFTGHLPRSRSYRETTTGSSGTPFAFLRDWKFAARRYSRSFQVFRFFGIKPTSKKVALKSWWSGKKRWLKPENVMYLAHSDFETKQEEYLKKIIDFGAEIIESYPSQLAFIAHIVKESGIKLPFKIAFVYSEQLWPDEREFIEKTLNLKVYSYYGTNEFGIVGFECSAQDGFHIFETELYIEVVDDEGKVCPPGMMGRIIATYSANFVMPFIRYDLGDTGFIIEEPCVCGLPYRRLRLFGRRDDYLLINNKRIYGNFFHPLFQKEYVNYIRQYQIIQTGPNTIVVKIIPETPLWQEDFMRKIKSRLKEILGQTVKVNIKLVDEIPPGPGDKHRAVIRQI